MRNPLTRFTNANPQQQVAIPTTGGPLCSVKHIPLVSHGRHLSNTPLSGFFRSLPDKTQRKGFPHG